MLPTKDQNDFNLFVNTQVSYNQGNMFISKSEEVINSYFSDVFAWLKNEAVFGFDLKIIIGLECILSWLRDICLIGLKNIQNI